MLRIAESFAASRHSFSEPSSETQKIFRQGGQFFNHLMMSSLQVEKLRCRFFNTPPLHDQCWSFLPADNVLTLYRARKKGFKLLTDGQIGVGSTASPYQLFGCNGAALNYRDAGKLAVDTGLQI